MAIGNLFGSIFAIAAGTCERSTRASGLIRNLHFKGKGRIVERVRAPSKSDVVAKCHGVRYRLDLRDNVQREIYFKIYERMDIKAALRLIPTGGVCIDVGANCGAFALPFAKRVGRHGLVHAFEPDTYAFSRLAYNSRLNGFESFLRCHRLAVSNTSGKVSFYRSDPAHSGWGSVERFTDITVQRDIVQAITLDEFLASEKIRMVDFLKVDIEAHEPELLEGTTDSLLKQVFRFILIEFNGLRLNQRRKSLDDYLTPLSQAGYSLVRPAANELQRIRTGSIPQERILTNLLFARKSDYSN